MKGNADKFLKVILWSAYFTYRTSYCFVLLRQNITQFPFKFPFIMYIIDFESWSLLLEGVTCL